MKIYRSVQAVRRTALLSALLAGTILFCSLYSTMKHVAAQAQMTVYYTYDDDGYAITNIVPVETNSADSGAVIPVIVLIIGLPIALYAEHKKKEQKEEEEAAAARRAARAASDAARRAYNEMEMKRKREASLKAEQTRFELPLTCPGCGATGRIDKDGRCEYCGRQLRIMQ